MYLEYVVRDNKYKRGIRKIITDDDLGFENKGIIKEVIRKLVQYTSEYEKKEVLEVSIAKWL